MFELSAVPGKPVLVVKASGLVTAADFQDVMPQIAPLLAEVRPTRALCDWTELEGWDREAESYRFLARLEFRGHFERVAVLADDTWDSEVRRLHDVAQLPVRRFPPEDRQAALHWLDSETA